MKIKKILTDNGTQFIDRFTSNKKDKDGKSIPAGWHAFDQACTDLKIEHRLIPPRHPQTNGIVERLNGRISEIVQQTRFASSYELQETLNN
jgi:transposase InsO family protein